MRTKRKNSDVIMHRPIGPELCADGAVLRVTADGKREYVYPPPPIVKLELVDNICGKRWNEVDRYYRIIIVSPPGGIKMSRRGTFVPEGEPIELLFTASDFHKPYQRVLRKSKLKEIPNE